MKTYAAEVAKTLETLMGNKNNDMGIEYVSRIRKALAGDMTRGVSILKECMVKLADNDRARIEEPLKGFGNGLDSLIDVMGEAFNKMHKMAETATS